MTEQKKAEQKQQEYHDQLQVLVEERTQDLLKSEQRFRNVAEAASDWFETDENHKVTFISERFYELFDLTHDQVLGKSRLEIVENQMKIPDVSQVWSEHLGALNDHKPFSISYWVQVEVLTRFVSRLRENLCLMKWACLRGISVLDQM